MTIFTPCHCLPSNQSYAFRPSIVNQVLTYSNVVLDRTLWLEESVALGEGSVLRLLEADW